MAFGKKKDARQTIDALDKERFGKNRDIYENQQFNRANHEKPMGPGIVYAGVIGGFVLGFVLVYLLWSFIAGSVGYVMAQASDNASSETTAEDPRTLVDTNGLPIYVMSVDGSYYQARQSEGSYKRMDEGHYNTPEEVPQPQWYLDMVAEYDAQQAALAKADDNAKDGDMTSKEMYASGSMGDAILYSFGPLVNAPWKILCSILGGVIGAALLGVAAKKQQQVQNQFYDSSDINQHENDAYIALPSELMEEYDWFPDAGAVANASVSTLISHVVLDPVGLKQVEQTRFVQEDVTDESGNIIQYKGEAMTDEDGNVITDIVSIIDKKFGEGIFDTIGLKGAGKKYRRRYDVRKIPYNPGGADREKLKFETVADRINGDWELPPYEPQRPAGAYLVDTSPTNTMV